MMTEVVQLFLLDTEKSFVLELNFKLYCVENTYISTAWRSSEFVRLNNLKSTLHSMYKFLNWHRFEDIGLHIMHKIT